MNCGEDPANSLTGPAIAVGTRFQCWRPWGIL